MSDPELLRKLELMKETVEQQLDMANENVRELEHKLALAEARAKAAEATANGGQRANTDSEAAARELVLRLEATEAQLAAEVQRAAKAEHRTAKRFDHLDGASMASAAILVRRCSSPLCPRSFSHEWDSNPRTLNCHQIWDRLAHGSTTHFFADVVTSSRPLSYCFVSLSKLRFLLLCFRIVVCLLFRCFPIHEWLPSSS